MTNDGFVIMFSCFFFLRSRLCLFSLNINRRARWPVVLSSSFFFLLYSLLNVHGWGFELPWLRLFLNTLVTPWAASLLALKRKSVILTEMRSSMQACGATSFSLLVFIETICSWLVLIKLVFPGFFKLDVHVPLSALVPREKTSKDVCVLLLWSFFQTDKSCKKRIECVIWNAFKAKNWLYFLSFFLSFFFSFFFLYRNLPALLIFSLFQR